MGVSNVYSLFQVALRRPRHELRQAGPLIEDEDGACARFALDSAAARVIAVEYQCSTCISLVALCEYLRDAALGTDVEALLRMRPEELLARFPEIPAVRQSRARIAVGALHAALVRHCIEPI